MEHEIGADHAGDGSACSDERGIGQVRGSTIHQGGDDTAGQIEEDEPDMAHRILDIVAENIKKNHVEQQMQGLPCKNM